MNKEFKDELVVFPYLDKLQNSRTFKIHSVQGEPRPQGYMGAPIFCKIDGIVKEDEGILISNGLHDLYVEEVSESGFVKTFLYAAEVTDSMIDAEFAEEFIQIC